VKTLCAAGLVAVLAGCAQPEATAPPAAPALVEDSLVPGTIGIIVRPDPAGVIVSALGPRGPAALDVPVEQHDTMPRV
jgi:hypothetical protein